MKILPNKWYELNGYSYPCPFPVKTEDEEHWHWCQQCPKLVDKGNAHCGWANSIPDKSWKEFVKESRRKEGN